MAISPPLAANEWVVSYDTETSSKSPYPVGKDGKPFGAWPFHPDNFPVAAGFAARGSSLHSAAHREITNRDFYSVSVPQMFVTQHGKFDLHYVRRFGVVHWDHLMQVPIWDLQIAEYILTRQQAKSISLDTLCEKYLGPGDRKHSEVTELFKQGKGSEEIPEAQLDAYLKQDVELQYRVYEKQLEVATPIQINLILQMGEAMKVCAEMEYNGFELDKERLATLQGDLMSETITLELAVTEALGSRFGVPEQAININSRHLWSMLIFGGTYTFEWKIPDGYYKSGAKMGQPKLKTTRKEATNVTSELRGEETKEPGIFVVDESVLERAAGKLGMPEINMYREYKLKSKLLNTYVNNILLNASNSYDGRLHHNLNQTVADTGRLSCSSPNMQNLPTDAEELRSCFISRWGKGGLIIEADFTALELIGFAFINEDPQLIADLDNGVDPHAVTGDTVYGRAMTESERRDVKGVNFGTIYGGGPATISKQTGISEEMVRIIQHTFKMRYKRGFANAKARAGDPIIKTPTGREYLTQGEYTKAMNYPVQGFSTGDLVPTVMGEMYRNLRRSDLLSGSCLLINQEHDKLVFDCKKEVLSEALTLIEDTLTAAPKIMKKVYGIDMPTGTPVKIKVGPDMGHMSKATWDYRFDCWIIVA